MGRMRYEEAIVYYLDEWRLKDLIVDELRRMSPEARLDDDSSVVVFSGKVDALALAREICRTNIAWREE